MLSFTLQAGRPHSVGAAAVASTAFGRPGSLGSTREAPGATEARARLGGGRTLSSKLGAADRIGQEAEGTRTGHGAGTAERLSGLLVEDVTPQ